MTQYLFVKNFYLVIVNLVLWVRSEFNGFAWKQYSITPLLQSPLEKADTTTPPSGSRLKPHNLGVYSLLDFGFVQGWIFKVGILVCRANLIAPIVLGQV